jgi:hypothetical protein
MFTCEEIFCDCSCGSTARQLCFFVMAAQIDVYYQGKVVI